MDFHLKSKKIRYIIAPVRIYNFLVEVSLLFNLPKIIKSSEEVSDNFYGWVWINNNDLVNNFIENPNTIKKYFSIGF